MLCEESKALAKINLHLRVLNRRDDGYHNIFSLMATVALHDLLQLDLTAESVPGEYPVSIRCTGGTNPDIITSLPVGDNLIAKAALGYISRTGITKKFGFSIKKNIPSGAGLGGGSADAAAALRLLNARYRLLSNEEMLSLAGRTGADVPFCISGGIALCEGIGERITQLTGNFHYPVLIANPGIHVNTARAYRLLDRGTVSPHQSEMIMEEKRRITDAVNSGSLDGVFGILANDFENPVILAYPAIGEIKKRMKEAGALFSAMTGSGSSVVGIFSDETAAAKAEKKMRGYAATVFMTHLE